MKPVIFELKKPFEGISDELILDIEYSGGENDELEFESIRVSNDNTSLTKEQISEIESILECGYTEDIISELTEYYKDSGIEFTSSY